MANDAGRLGRQFLLVIVAAALLALLYSIREILLPFLVAAALAFLGYPLLRWLHRLGLPRWVAALITYVVILAVVGVLAYLIADLITGEIAAASRQAPDIIHGLVQQVLGQRRLTILGTPIDAEAVADRLLADARATLTSESGIALLASRGLVAVMGIFLTLVLLIYFLISAPRLLRGLLWLVPPGHRPEIRTLAIRIAPLLGRYVRGVLAVVAYASLVAWIGYGLVFHLSHAVLLSFVVGVLELIPVVGPIASAGLVGAAAIQEASWFTTASVMVWAIALRLSIDQLVGPLVLGRAVTLHPVVIIFSFLAGGVLLGIPGVVLAVPVAAAIKLTLAHYYGEPPDRRA